MSSVNINRSEPVITPAVRAPRGLTETTQAKCHLLSLPAELRNRVYKLILFPPCEPTDRGAQWFIRDRYPYAGERWMIGAEPDVTRISHQIRTETLPVWYGGNVWFFRIRDLNAYSYWLDDVGNDKVKFIQQICLTGYLRCDNKETMTSILFRFPRNGRWMAELEESALRHWPEHDEQLDELQVLLRREQATAKDGFLGIQQVKAVFDVFVASLDRRSGKKGITMTKDCVTKTR